MTYTCTSWPLHTDLYDQCASLPFRTDLNALNDPSIQALIEKNAVEIVKQMQRLKGLDDEYDSDSAASNRLQTR